MGVIGSLSPDFIGGVAAGGETGTLISFWGDYVVWQ